MVAPWIALPLLLAGAGTGTAPEPKARPFMKGMTVSCPDYGEIWGSGEMAQALKEIRSLGVEWVAIHPYAAVRRDGSVRFHSPEQSDYLRRAIQMAAKEGLRLFWKPHLAYWGSFDWRGTIGFGGDELQWRRFFEGYRAFIVQQAMLAEQAKAPLLAVGLEYEQTMHREAEWRAIIRAVREVYRGKLTYAANWDGLARVRFWDALDYVGVQAYFPISRSETPGRDELLRGWEAPLAELRALAERTGKPILITEIGYARSELAARQPWTPAVRDSHAIRTLRTQLMETALDRLGSEPAIAGLFWWKWMPGDSPHDRDFSMKDPEARAVLGTRWAVRP